MDRRQAQKSNNCLKKWIKKSKMNTLMCNMYIDHVLRNISKETATYSSDKKKRSLPPNPSNKRIAANSE
jgi:hypothetical protein